MLQYPYKVSVCIFVYNHEKYISDCLMSVLSQNIDGGIEILVGDDCSTDNTSSVIFGLMDKYPNQITYFRHGENMGAHDNVKFLVDKAQGEYIAHLDGDDYWLPGKLSAQMEFIVNNISTSAVFNNSVVVNDKKEAAGFLTIKYQSIST